MWDRNEHKAQVIRDGENVIEIRERDARAQRYLNQCPPRGYLRGFALAIRETIRLWRQR